MRVRACAVALACLAVALSVRVARAELPCAADIAALCKDVPVGGGRIQACLKENESKISQACRSKVDDLAREIRTAAVVCRWDIGRFCTDVPHGSGRIASCLQDHASQLSPECKAQMESMKK